MKEICWTIKTQGDSAEVEHLSKTLNIHQSLANLLVQRGLKTEEDVNLFFNPDKADLHDPYLMKDMDKAVDRIEKAIQNNERILVYGDYDVDGTTAVALVYSFLKYSLHYDNLEYYIPDRQSEGYGVSLKSVNYAKDKGFSLVITLDCGIKAIDKIDYGVEKGIDYIICDHHYPGESLPKAYATLNPKQDDCNYPYKHLSGCGVGFKFIQAIAKHRGMSDESALQYVDLVVLSIASDIVPITGENRILASLGLNKINTNPCMGLSVIIQIADMKQKKISIDDIIFRIGPRLNAAGRMETGALAVKLLTENDFESAKKVADTIDRSNKQRKSIDQSITSEAMQMIESDPLYASRKTIVLFNPNWNKGVIGIVASRLIETYYKPTVILTTANNDNTIGLASGSARSVEGFDLYSAIDRCSEYLENFGGHMYAAGVTMKVENVENFKKKFEEVVAETIQDQQTKPVIEIDTEIQLEDITDEYFNVLKQFEPFGPENPQPIFLTKRVYDNGHSRKVGSKQEHLRLEIIQESHPFEPFQAIGFQMSPHYNNIRKGNSFDICYTIDENEFRDIVTRQLRIKDIKY